MNCFSEKKIHVGISACVLGEPVRYDGGHKRSRFCTDVLTEYFDFVPICPEMSLGMGTPRPTIQLQQNQDRIIARTADGKDVTEGLVNFGQEQVKRHAYLSGYIFCAKSPSCGVERVKVYQKNGHSIPRGTGLYAEQWQKMAPLLPIEENGRLQDPLLRESFISRVYAYHEWQKLLNLGLSAFGLIQFHRRYKFLLLAHDPLTYRQVGPWLGDLSNDLEKTAQRYISAFMGALKKPASRKNHVNVLYHLQGYFKRQLSSRQRKELAETIDSYLKGTLPLLAPITLIRHYLGEYPNTYLHEQRYLAPYPDSLKLRYGL